MTGASRVLLSCTLLLLAVHRGQANHVSPNNALATLPREELHKCLDDLWFGLSDTAEMVSDITLSCVDEQVEDVKFWVQDAQELAAEIGEDLKSAVTECVDNGSVLGCVDEVGLVVVEKAEPVALLIGQAVSLYLRIGYRPLFELLGCTLLPALLPALWDTFLDLIIMVQCVM